MGLLLTNLLKSGTERNFVASDMNDFDILHGGGLMDMLENCQITNYFSYVTDCYGFKFKLYASYAGT